MPELFVVNGICRGTVFFLPDVPTVLGRSAECHVQIADPWISSMHALFERRGGELWVVDLDSRNGTFVDGERVQERQVRPGVKIRFGRTDAELRSGAGAEAERPPPIEGETTIIRYLADLVGADDAPSLSGESPTPRRRGTSGITASGRRQVAVLNEIGRITMGGTPVDETLRLILRVLAASVGAERASTLLLDERGEMVPHATEPPGEEPRISATVVQSALRSRAGILTTDAQQDARFATSQSVIAHGIRSCICAPIWADNRILGAVLLDRSYADPFTATDLELATLVGFQAALAVERARLADQTRISEDQRQRLLRHLPPAAASAVLADDRDLLAPSLRPDAAAASVIFGDIAELAAARSPQEAAERLLGAQDAAREILLAHGAAVDARMSGEIAGVFGLTPSDDGAALRAAAAADAIRTAVARLEAERPEPRLEARVGVESGRVLAGNFGPPERPELRAVGPALETASRLAAEASGGEVLLGPDASERLGSALELGERRARGERPLRGLPAK